MSARSLDRPRYLQFLEEALEWSELSYRALGARTLPDAAVSSAAARSRTDPSFLAFLEAEYARVLIPVEIPRAAEVLYFLASGMIWMGSPYLVHINPGHLPVRYELLSVAPRASQEERVGAPWRVRVPTQLKVMGELELIREPSEQTAEVAAC